MAADAGESAGEAPATAPIATLLAAAIESLDGTARLRTEAVAATAVTACVRVPPRAFAQALRGVLKNALEAAGGAGEVRVDLALAAERWRLAVTDRGPGMTPEVLAHAGEPFFTTKNGDGLARGMGLGLFLARVVLERLGGELEIDSALGRGTTVTLVVPAADAATIRRVADPGASGMLAADTGRTTP
jgi:two-component system sensor histidine kinase RegB